MCGATPACLEVGLALYGQAIDNMVPVSSMRVAEMAKLLENIHRALNIGLVNEMKPVPGPGGHCIPIDPFYLVLGIACKKNVDDVRESPAARIMELLRERGAHLSYSDPHVPEFPRMREHQFELESVALDAKFLAAQDCVVLVTDHDAFDYELIAKLLVDTRGRYPKAAENIVKA